MLVFLPVNLWDVKWEAASGRPFSTFEMLLLRAVKDKIATVTDLQRTFKVHRRVIIEGLATLVDAAWLAFGRDGGLVLTSAGASAAVAEGAVPPALEERIRPARVRLVQERVCGQLCLREDIYYRSQKDLDDIWNDGVVVPPGDVPFSVEPGMVRPFLRLSQGTYPRWIGPAEPYRVGADYLVIWADPDTGNVVHLPRAWVSLLKDQIVGWARHKKRTMIQLGRVPPSKARGEEHFGTSVSAGEPAQLQWTSTVAYNDILCGLDAHVAFLKDRLARARTYVLIASTELAGEVARALEPELEAALARGVFIDVLYGFRSVGDQSKAHSDALAVLKKLKYDSSQKGSGGRLLVGAQPSGSRARFIASDPEGKHEVLMGSFDWFGERAAGSDVSIRLSHPGVVAQAYRIIADLAKADESLSTGTAPARLQNVAAELEHQLTSDQSTSQRVGSEEGDEADQGIEDAVVEEAPRSGAGEVVLRLYLDRQVDAAFKEALALAKRRIVISAPSIIETAEWSRRLRDALNRGAHVELYCGRLSEQLRGEWSEVLVKLGGNLHESSDARGSWLVIDDDRVIIGTDNWLSQHGGRGYAERLAVELTGAKIASRLPFLGGSV